jgi:hypothetical protein
MDFESIVSAVPPPGRRVKRTTVVAVPVDRADARLRSVARWTGVCLLEPCEHLSTGVGETVELVVGEAEHVLELLGDVSRVPGWRVLPRGPTGRLVALRTIERQDEEEHEITALWAQAALQLCSLLVEHATIFA